MQPKPERKPCHSDQRHSMEGLALDFKKTKQRYALKKKKTQQKTKISKGEKSHRRKGMAVIKLNSDYSVKTCFWTETEWIISLQLYF